MGELTENGTISKYPWTVEAVARIIYGLSASGDISSKSIFISFQQMMSKNSG